VKSTPTKFAQANIITHRGLEPSKKGFYSESTYEAFEDHLSRGFGVEFDVNFVKDGIAICHDSSLERLTMGRDCRQFQDLLLKDLSSIKLPNGRFCEFGELLGLIEKGHSRVNALHLKGEFQNKRNLEELAEFLGSFAMVLPKLLVFDLKPDSAEYLKNKLPSLRLAASVSHRYDIERYNPSVKGTLLSIDEVLALRDVYDWVWLDEWDRVDRNQGNKKFYGPSLMTTLRESDFGVALVTPELHATSPHLLGGECHRDAKSQKHLFQRIGEILTLGPDAVCTDYPFEVGRLMNAQYLISYSDVDYSQQVHL
jgi:hypothetical protein